MRATRNCTLAAVFLSAAFAADNNTFLLRNVTVHPVSGPKIDNGSILVVDGRIAEVGVKIAAKGKIRIVDGKGLHAYPGMIDSGSPVGLAEIASVRESVDTGEIGEFNPQLRAAIAVNPSSEHIPVVRANGITAVMVTPAGAGGGRGVAAQTTFIAGQASLVHLDGWTWEEMEIRRGAALQMNWPVIRSSSGLPAGLEARLRGAGRPAVFSEARRNQQQQVQKIQEFFDAARRYQKAKAAGGAVTPDVRLDAMIPVLEGKLPVMITAVREREIREAVQFAAKENIRIVLAGVRRPGKMIEEIAAKRIPVILGTTFTAPLEQDDPYDEQYALPGLLHRAGVKFAFASFGAQFARNLPYQASQAVPYGLPYDEALKSVTLNAAEIWGVSDLYGSIEKGKAADLIVTDGDPLEIPTGIRMMFIKGVAVDLESRHTRLYKRYLARP